MGDMTHPSGLYEVNSSTFAVTPLAESYNGVPFNSLNDVCMGKSGHVWFTDPSYGSVQDFKPLPQLDNAVYRGYYGKDDKIVDVKAVLFGFVKPNAVVLAPSEKTLYVTDSGYATGNGPVDPNLPRAVYAVDLDANKMPIQSSRRKIADVDVGVPDGVKTDEHGNLFVGTGDGVCIYNPVTGELLQKVLIPTGEVANLVIVKKTLVMLNENRIYIARLH